MSDETPTPAAPVLVETDAQRIAREEAEAAQDKVDTNVGQSGDPNRDRKGEQLASATGEQGRIVDFGDGNLWDVDGDGIAIGKHK